MAQGRRRIGIFALAEVPRLSVLVANAVLHGGGCLELTLAAHDSHVTVCAADGSAVLPRRRTADDGGGRGVEMIEAFSQRWTVENYHGGKRVCVVLSPYPDIEAG